MRKASVVPEGRYTLPSSGALSGMCAGLMRFSTTPFEEGRPFYPACPVHQEVRYGRRPSGHATVLPQTFGSCGSSFP